MPPFPKPSFSFPYRLERERSELQAYMATAPGRKIPKRVSTRLLVATWNVANLGVQDRTENDYALIAEIISWFDVIALQEVNDNLAGLEAIRSHLSSDYAAVYSDAGGNNERFAFLYDTAKVSLREEIGELAPPPRDNKRLRDVRRVFEGFDRSPYLATFEAGTFVFTLVTVHLFYGGTGTDDMARRTLETLAVARWADIRRKSKWAITRDVICLGDFNLPKVSSDDKIYRALTYRGLHLPPHQTQIGTSLSGDKHYDQIAFFPQETNDQFTGNSGVVDFDGALFAGLWRKRGRKDFDAFVRYHLSDHRPMWVEFRMQ